MRLRCVLKHTIPTRVRHLGWRGYYRTRDHWLKTIVGCQTTQKIVALTFDDGPNPSYTLPILDVLAHYQIEATFFLLGRNVVAYPDIAREVAQAGHAIGNHTFTHPCLADCGPIGVARELRQCQRTMREVIGIVPKVMRPPFGAQDAASFLAARITGHAVVTWSASGDDWQGDPATVVAERILMGIKPGGIVLLHDGWEQPSHQPEWRPEYDMFQDRSPTIEALPMIIEPLQSQGYQFVTLPEMMRMRPLVRQSWFV